MADKSYNTLFNADVSKFTKALDNAISKSDSFKKQIAKDNEQLQLSNNKLSDNTLKMASENAKSLETVKKASKDKLDTILKSNESEIKANDNLKSKYSDYISNYINDTQRQITTSNETTKGILDNLAKNKDASAGLADSYSSSSTKINSALNGLKTSNINYSENTKKSFEENSKILEKSYSSYDLYKAKVSSTLGSIKSSYDTAKSNTQSFAQKTKSSLSIVKSSYDEAKKSTQNLTDKTAGLVTQVAKLALAIAGVNSIKNVVESAFAKVDTIKSTEKAIAQLTGSTESGAQAMQAINDAVQNTPVSVDDLTGAVKGFISAGGELDIIPDMLQATLDSAYAVGNGKESIDYISSAFKGLQASGVASLEDINRLVDQNIPAVKILANTYGLSVADMKKSISDGALTSDDAIKALIKGIEEGTSGVAGNTTAMAGQVQNASNTIEGATSNIKTAIVNNVAGVVKSYYSDIIVILNNVKEYLKENSAEWQVMLKTIVDNVVVFAIAFGEEFLKIMKSAKELYDAILPLFNFLFKIFGKEDEERMEFLGRSFAKFVGIVLTLKTIQSTTNAVKLVLSPLTLLSKTAVNATNGFLALGNSGKTVTSIFGVVKVGLQSLYAVMLANPILLVVVAITGIVVALVTLYKKNEEFRNFVNKIWAEIVEIFNKAFEGIKKIFTFYTELYAKIFKGLFEIIQKVIKFYIDYWTAVFTGFFDFVKKLINGVSDIFGKIGNFFNGGKATYTLETQENQQRTVNTRYLNEQPDQGIAPISNRSVLNTLNNSQENNKGILKTASNTLGEYINTKGTDKKESIRDIVINVQGNIDSKDTVDYLVRKIKMELAKDLQKDNRKAGILA